MHKIHRAWSFCLWLALGGIAGPPAQAGTVWLCGLSEDLVRLVCVADVGEPELQGAQPPGTTAVVNGTKFPLDPRRQYVVDMWSPPDEFEHAEQLARATICFRSPGCEVLMAALGAGVQRWAPLRAAMRRF